MLVPINDSQTMLDLVRHLAMTCCHRVAQRAWLRSITPVLTVKALRDARVDIKGVVMIGKENRDNRARRRARYGEVPLVGRIPLLETIDRSGLLHVFRSNFDAQLFSSDALMTTDPALSIWHPFTQEALDPAPIEIVRGAGAYLYTSDGREILDAISSWWVNIHGHSHPAIAEAIAEQARKLEHVIFAGFTHRPAEELAKRLRGVLPKSLEHIFFSDDGSTAVEVALKMALQYWQNIGKPAKKRIVALEHAYHGDTAGAMSVGADSSFVAAFSEMRFPVLRVPSAYCFRCPVGKIRATCDIDCVGAVRAAAGRAARRNSRADRRAAAARRRRDDHAPGGISASGSGNFARSTTCCSSPMKF